MRDLDKEKFNKPKIYKASFPIQKQKKPTIPIQIPTSPEFPSINIVSYTLNNFTQDRNT